MKSIILGDTKRAIITRITCAALFIICLIYPNFSLIRVNGDSMEPTLANGDVCILYKQAYSDTDPQLNDIVTLTDGEGDIVIKRIIACPGDLFEIREYYIHINGKILLDELGPTDSYTFNTLARLDKDWFIYFGDNRSETSWSTVRRENIHGKIVFPE